MATVRAWRQRWSRVDPVAPLVAVVALVVYVLHGFHGFLGRDLGLYVYAGQQVADGVPPYVGTLNRAGPLAQLLPGLAIAVGRLAGIGDVIAARLLYCVFAVAAVSAAYVLGRNLFSSRWTGLATASTLLSFGGFIAYATNGPREKTPMVLCLILVCWAVDQRRWLVAGALLSIATLTWQPAFPVGLAAVAVAVLMQPGGRICALGRFVVGAAIPTAVCVIYFAVAGALKEFFDGFYFINAQYTSADPFMGHMRHNLRILDTAYGLSLRLFIVGTVALLVVGLLTVIVPSRRREESAAAVVSIAAAGLVAAAWTFHDFNSWPDLFVMLPFAAVGIGALVNEAARLWSAKVALVVSLAVASVATAFAAGFSITHREDLLSLQQREVNAVVRSLPPDATFVSIEAPQALALSGKTNPGRIQMFGLGLDRYVDDTYPGGLDGFGRWVGEQDAAVIAVHGRVKDWLAPTLDAGYSFVGTTPAWAWYVNDSVGPTTITALKAKLKRHAP